MSLREINKRLKNDFAPRELRVQGLLKKRKETLEKFLINFFTKWNLNKNTLYVDTNEVQTEPGKRRSFGDIYSIVKYYYPNTHVRELKTLLYETLYHKVPNFRTSPCNQIKKRVWYKGNLDQKTAIIDKKSSDEFGMTVQEWLDL